MNDLGALLARLALKFGSATAVVGEKDSYSFARLDAEASKWARAFRQAGYGSESRIGLLAGNGPDWLSVAFGVWRCGATLVPISTFVTPRELYEIVEHADLSLLVAQPRLRSHSFDEALRSLRGLPLLRSIVELDGNAADFLASTASHLDDPVPLDPATIATILYTSGTTGRAKGVRLSHRAILSTVLPTAARTGLAADDRLLSTLPLFWVAGLVIRALPTLATGCTLILPETFVLDTVIELLHKHRPTALHLRPPQVGQILGHRDFTADLLAGVRKGGGRSEWYTPHLTQARLITGYGMTEMSGYVTALDSQDPPELLQSGIGAPLPRVEIRIVASDGSPVPPGVTGEIQVRGPGMFSGYHKEPAQLGLTEDGWFITGDLGSVDEDGTFHFSGRSKDLLRIKGINVSPVEVETVLATHPAIEAAYVVGLPPDGLDQRLVALVVAKATLTADEIHAYVKPILSHYKRPEAYLFLERHEVPLGGTSKPQRAQLAAIAASRL